jgi:rare lipoprotein A
LSCVEEAERQLSCEKRGMGAVRYTESFLKLKFILFLCAALVPVTVAIANTQTGIASVYSTESGLRTASGDRLNPGAFTAAHRSLPFGSKARVTNLKNKRSVVVTINDRGPFVRGRIIDLTPAGARALGFSGLASVTVERETNETRSSSSGTPLPQTQRVRARTARWLSLKQAAEKGPLGPHASVSLWDAWGDASCRPNAGTDQLSEQFK